MKTPPEGETRMTTAPAKPAFSTTVFARRPDGRCVRVSPASGVFNCPCIHPNGKEVVCQGEANGGVRVWRLSIEGGKAEPLSPPGWSAWSPSYSWDGRRIVFCSDGGSGDGPRTMDDFFTWPPKPLRLNIFTMDSAGGEAVQVTDGEHYDCRPSFSPDGRAIVFTSNRLGPMQIWAVSSDGGAAPRALQPAGETGGRPWCSRDGRHVFFHANIEGRHRICRIPMEGGPRFALPNDDRGMTHGAFAVPTEDCLLVHSSRAGGSLLWRLPLDGREPELVPTPGIRLAGHATQSLDGMIAFDSVQREVDAS